MVEILADPTEVLIEDLNRLVAPDESAGRLRENVAAFMADAIKFGLPPEVYNLILGDFIKTPEDRLALPHLHSLKKI